MRLITPMYASSVRLWMRRAACMKLTGVIIMVLFCEPVMSPDVSLLVLLLPVLMSVLLVNS